MSVLAPSILSADLSRLGEEVAAIEAGGASYVHVDVMDGSFVPNITFGAPLMKSLLGKTALPFDVHLMIVRPELRIADFVTPQTAFVTVHAEACTHLDRVVHQIRELGVGAGVALNPATPLCMAEQLLPELDQLLIMSVNPGFGGQRLIPYTLEKIRRLKALREAGKTNPDLVIGIDGGVDLENIGPVLEAGADLVVAGSAVFGGGTPREKAEAFCRRMR